MLNHLRDKLYILGHRGEYGKLNDLLRFYTFLLVIWGFYRVLLQFPEWVEELILKPLVFLGPMLMRLKEEGKNWEERFKSVGIKIKNLFAAVAYGLSLGVFYLFVGRLGYFFRFGGLGTLPYGRPVESVFMVVILTIATAISEQIVFMGYLLPRLNKIWKDEWKSATTVAILFGLIQLPILVFTYRLMPSLVIGQFLLAFILGFGNAILMLRLQNVAAPILSHALWGMAVLLFR